MDVSFEQPPFEVLQFELDHPVQDLDCLIKLVRLDLRLHERPERFGVVGITAHLLLGSSLLLVVLGRFLDAPVGGGRATGVAAEQLGRR
ncbi:hypothetical protein L484_002394 [Morus notabilis]|uniref:Uncharacterized protein n=1 Tax=Morus notabilis TaxID=981085 RepID=W9RAA5_9ROSA|nr:hypothetical protein L484_002394 [Morus notabilis]